MEKVEILDSIRNLANTIGRTPTRNEFREKTKITEHTLFKYFPSWREALRAAGLESNSTNVKLDDEDLLIDWGIFVRENRQIPTRYQYERKGKYSYSTFQNHFGKWAVIPTKFREFAQGKPEWEDVLSILPLTVLSHSIEPVNKQKKIHNPDTGYVDLSRLNELRGIKNKDFDLAKLIKFCEELNECYQNNYYFAVAMLVRAIVDHVPPIFKCKNFSEVSTNYGTKSFRENMQHLQNSLRKIADGHLHTQIRSKEVLPNKTQINFSNDLDILLSEIVRLLK
ncbi:MAG: hypothetical protein JNK81_04300 [Anaerolineales bacterium]|nr:hypothetical protein [Anaerolineales bacterium]